MFYIYSISRLLAVGKHTSALQASLAPSRALAGSGCRRAGESKASPSPPSRFCSDFSTSTAASSTHLIPFDSKNESYLKLLQQVKQRTHEGGAGQQDRERLARQWLRSGQLSLGSTPEQFLGCQDAT